MAYRPLHPTQAATVTRLVSSSVDGQASNTETTVGTPVVGVEDVTGKLRRAPGGVDVKLALRLYTGDVATAYRPWDLVAITHRGEALKLQIEEIVGPFGSGSRDHQELVVVSRFGAAVGVNSAVA